MDKVDLKKKKREKCFFCIFFQSTHQVGMKNVVECSKHFFGYFNALVTNSVAALVTATAEPNQKPVFSENLKSGLYVIGLEEISANTLSSDNFKFQGIL